jgi:hypothetical protein
MTRPPGRAKTQTQSPRCSLRNLTMRSRAWAAAAEWKSKPGSDPGGRVWL